MKKLLVLILALVPLAAHSEVDDGRVDNPANLSVEQIVNQCTSECRNALFVECINDRLEDIFGQCFDPARQPHPLGPEVESMTCTLLIANTSTLCNQTVTHCSLQCSLRALHPEVQPIRRPIR